MTSERSGDCDYIRPTRDERLEMEALRRKVKSSSSTTPRGRAKKEDSSNTRSRSPSRERADDSKSSKSESESEDEDEELSEQEYAKLKDTLLALKSAPASTPVPLLVPVACSLLPNEGHKNWDLWRTYLGPSVGPVPENFIGSKYDYGSDFDKIDRRGVRAPRGFTGGPLEFSSKTFNTYFFHATTDEKKKLTKYWTVDFKAKETPPRKLRDEFSYVKTEKDLDDELNDEDYDDMYEYDEDGDWEVLVTLKLVEHTINDKLSSATLNTECYRVPLVVSSSYLTDTAAHFLSGVRDHLGLEKKVTTDHDVGEVAHFLKSTTNSTQLIAENDEDSKLNGAFTALVGLVWV